MGSVDLTFAADLRDRIGLRRAVETGTFRGITARRLAGVFAEVVTIELSEELHASAAASLRDLPHVRAVQGHSAEILHQEARADTPTLYFLDGHWSGGNTEGAEDECPVLGELQAIGVGHPDDCLIVDDARLFTSAPPPPHDPAQWPTVAELFDAIRALRPDHVVTVLDDQVIAVPAGGKPALDAHGLRVHAAGIGLRERAGAALAAVRARVGR
jgi:hypothetical protein